MSGVATAAATATPVGPLDGVVAVLGVAGTITTGIGLAALSLLIAFLLAGLWLRGQNETVRAAIASGDDAVLARTLGGTAVSLDLLTPEQKLDFAREELRTRYRSRMAGYALSFFAFLALLGFALALALAPRREGGDAVRLDSLQVLDVLRLIAPDDRMATCAKLMAASDCTRAAATIKALDYVAPTRAQAAAVEAAVEQGGVTGAQLAELAACGGAYDFTVTGDRLRCADGSEVPTLRPSRSLRPLTGVEAIVFHSTESPDNSFAPISTLLADGRPDLPGPMAHILISRSGAVVQFAPLNERVYHAGITEPWHGLRIGNANSIGVELIGRLGTPFTPAQIAAAKGIATALARAYPVRAIVGHSDIAPRRKRDPGPLFPIDAVRAAAGVAMR